MSLTLAVADRSRVSNDMIPVTTDIILSMLSQSMVGKDDLAGIVRDVHLALTDISMQNIELAFNFGESFGVSLPSALGETAVADIEPSYGDNPKAATQRAVDQLLKFGNKTSTIFEPKTPPSVRMRQTTVSPPALPIPPQPPAPVVARISEPAVPPDPEPAKAKLRIAAPVAEPVVQKAAPSPVAKSGPKPGAQVTAWTGKERRSNPILAKPKTSVLENILPRRLSSIEEALTMDYIVCLEDGKKARGSLVEHLGSLKIPMSPDQYREKWKLPAEYPMAAPSSIIKRGEIHEIDLVTGKVKKAR